MSAGSPIGLLMVMPHLLAAGVPTAIATRTSESIRIDGTLDETVWRAAIPIGPLTQRDPLSGQAATEQTDVPILVDAGNLYVGVVCHDRTSAGPEKRALFLEGAGVFDVVGLAGNEDLIPFFSRRIGLVGDTEILEPGNDVFLVVNRDWLHDLLGHYVHAFDRATVKIQYTVRL